VGKSKDLHSIFLDTNEDENTKKPKLGIHLVLRLTFPKKTYQTHAGTESMRVAFGTKSQADTFP